MTAKALAKPYKLRVRSAHYHDEGNWYWNLRQFPGAYFDPNGCVVFETEEDYRFRGLLHLSIGPRNTGIRHKDLGMSIADVPGYRKLDPPPGPYGRRSDEQSRRGECAQLFQGIALEETIATN